MFRKHFKRIVSIPLAAALLFSMPGLSIKTASAENTEPNTKEVFIIGDHVGGYIPIDLNIYQSETSKSSGPEFVPEEQTQYPSYYRSDEQEWSRSIRVKDQVTTSLCWAFATTSAAEYSYAKELYDKTGEVADVTELSPGHLAQFLYNREGDPLGSTENDYNVAYNDNWAILGGNTFLASLHLFGWSGFASEESAPFSATADHAILKQDGVYWDSSRLPYDESLAYDNVLTLQNTVMYDLPDIDTIKDIILEYGAGVVDVNYVRDYVNMDELRDPEDPDSRYDSGRSFFNYSGKYGSNHVVTIIGWDDNYPKENFTHSLPNMEDEEAFKLTTPQNDGAWIIQNSWSEESNEDGFFYVSYESAEFNTSGSFVIAYDVQPADTYKYNFYYDGNAAYSDTLQNYTDGQKVEYYTKSGTSAANVYTNTTGEPVDIDAVGFVSMTSGLVNYDISIYTGIEDPTDPTSGTLIETESVYTTTAGCKTFELDTPVAVMPDDTFAIVIDFKNTVSVGIEEYADYGWVKFISEIAPGQSFFCGKNSDEWIDLYDYDVCFRIKAFANPSDASVPVKAESIEFAEDTINLATKSSIILSPEVLPADTENPTLTWSSSDEKIATVDENGKVTARTYGTAVITAQTIDGSGISASVTVNTKYYDVNGSNIKGEENYEYWYDPVYWATDSGISKGYYNVYFAPGKDCERREFLVFLWRLAGCPDSDIDPTKAFTDVAFTESSDSYKAIAWAADYGIVKGYKDGTLKPMSGISRKDVMIMLYRFAGKPEITESMNVSFTDVAGKYKKTSDTYKAICWGYSCKITKGYTSGEYAGMFGTGLLAKRKDTITFLYRYNNL